MSPAAKLIEQHKDQTQDICFTFFDPHNGLGGLGASSAQFLLVSKYLSPALSISARLTQYRALFQKDAEKENTPSDRLCYIPSGADVAAQALGHLAWIHTAGAQYTSLQWPFDTIEYCLLRTKSGVATHNHLASLHPLSQAWVHSLGQLAHRAATYFTADAALDFCRAVQAYGDALAEAHFITPESLDLVKQCKQQPGVLAAKGCGAMGADIVLVLLNSAMREDFYAWLRKTHRVTVNTECV